jgi:ubiquinone/menaquinone biosynthesis C-methylase UbiE
MLRLLHDIASQGWAYDRIQDLAGAREVYRRLGRHLAGTPSPCWLLDVGGGTGRTRRLLSGATRYVCLDMEGPKLAHLRRTGRTGTPVQGDATRMPFRTASVDLVVCVDVSHHLTDSELDAALDEVKRVLHPSGRFVFLDAVLNDRWIGRTLWSLDRGSHPRRAIELRAAVTRGFYIRDEEQFRLAHEYLLLVSQPLPSTSRTASSII